jgi:hypothetical protein
MCHFGRFRFISLCIQLTMMEYNSHRVSPFGHLRVKAFSGSPKLFAGFTSFFAFRCQGIHQQPLTAWSQKLLFAANCLPDYFIRIFLLTYWDCLSSLRQFIKTFFSQAPIYISEFAYHFQKDHLRFYTLLSLFVIGRFYLRFSRSWTNTLQHLIQFRLYFLTLSTFKIADSFARWRKCCGYLDLN